MGQQPDFLGAAAGDQGRGARQFSGITPSVAFDPRLETAFAGQFPDPGAHPQCNGKTDEIAVLALNMPVRALGACRDPLQGVRMFIAADQIIGNEAAGALIEDRSEDSGARRGLRLQHDQRAAGIFARQILLFSNDPHHLAARFRAGRTFDQVERMHGVIRGNGFFRIAQGQPADRGVPGQRHALVFIHGGPVRGKTDLFHVRQSGRFHFPADPVDRLMIMPESLSLFDFAQFFGFFRHGTFIQTAAYLPEQIFHR